MKAIVEYTNEEHAKMSRKYAELMKAIEGHSRDELIKDFTCRTGYAHYKFSGEYTELFTELLGRAPESDEIIMLIDCGFNHFGATCNVNHDTRHFAGRVNTD